MKAALQEKKSKKQHERDRSPRRKPVERVVIVTSDEDGLLYLRQKENLSAADEATIEKALRDVNTAASLFQDETWHALDSVGDHGSVRLIALNTFQ